MEQNITAWHTIVCPADLIVLIFFESAALQLENYSVDIMEDSIKLVYLY